MIKKKWFSLICTVLSFTLLFTSGVSASAKPMENGNHQAQEYSGKEIFKGIIFGQGDVAILFPELWTKDMLNAVNNKDAKDYVDKITSQISIEDPAYYYRLKDSIDSNNPIAIDESFSEGAILLENAMESLGVNFENDPITGQWVAAAVVIVLAAAGMYVYAGHTAVQAVTVYNKVGYWGSSNSEVTDLEKEIFINNVTERL